MSSFDLDVVLWVLFGMMVMVFPGWRDCDFGGVWEWGDAEVGVLGEDDGFVLKVMVSGLSGNMERLMMQRARR